MSVKKVNVIQSAPIVIKAKQVGIQGIAGGGGAWGTITGTLSDQTDLQGELDGKQDDLTLTTTGSSGASTLIGATLNIPQYTGGGGAIDWANPIAINTATTLTIGKENVVSDLAVPADFTVTLPDGSGLSVGDQLVVTMSTALTELVTVDGFSSQLIGKESDYVLWSGEILRLEWNGSYWTILVDGRIPMKFVAYSATSVTGISSGVFETAKIDTETADVGGVFDTAAYKFVPRRGGKWQLNGSLAFAPATTLTRTQISFGTAGSPGTTIKTGSDISITGMTANASSVSGVLDVSVGDEIVVAGYATTASSTWSVNQNGASGYTAFSGSEQL